ASELMRTVLLARSVAGASHDDRFTYGTVASSAEPPVSTPYGDIGRGTSLSCFQAPFLGGSYQDRPPGTDAALFDFPPGLVAYKDFSDQVDRRNLNKS